MNFTEEQLRAFHRYVKVQKTNRFNMLDPRAASAASLSRDEMVFCMEHYKALAAASQTINTKESK